MADGFIRQRGNAWQVIVHAGRDPVTGKRRNLTGTARTKREAQALRARLLTQVDEGRRPATDATLAQLLERWLEMADLAWSTRVTYKGYIEQGLHRAHHPADAWSPGAAAPGHRHARPLLHDVARPRRRRRQADGPGHCPPGPRHSAPGARPGSPLGLDSCQPGSPGHSAAPRLRRDPPADPRGGLPGS